MVKIMSTTRILGTLLLTGTFALAATATQAQSIARSSQSQERQDSRSDEHSKLGRPWAIVGSWFGTTVTASDNSSRSTPMERSSARYQAKPASTPHVRRTRRLMASGATLARGGSA